MHDREIGFNKEGFAIGLITTMKADLNALQKFIDTVHKLRAPGGCPWDREQTHQSLRKYLMEESHEVLEVLDQIDSPEKMKNEKVRNALKEELGDLLLQIALHSEIAREVGAFDIYDVARAIDEKLISRHPHVFGNVQVSGSGEVVKNWEEIKKSEKAAKGESTEKKSALDGVKKGIPSLARAEEVIQKVTKVGFQWPDENGPIAKLEEEINELKNEIKKGDIKKAGEEIGDLLFSVCNVAHFAKISPEDSLRTFLARFEKRFRHVEKRASSSGKDMKDHTLAELDTYWDEAKKLEREDRL